MGFCIVLFMIIQDGQSDLDSPYIPATQVLKDDQKESIRSTVTRESTEYLQQSNNRDPFANHENTKYEDANIVQRRDNTANDGPDSTCLEMVNCV